MNSMDREYKECPLCHGSGEVPDVNSDGTIQCAQCMGSGEVPIDE